MAEVVLIRIERELAASLDVGSDHFESEYQLRLGPASTIVRDIVGHPPSNVDDRKPVSPWGGYLVVDGVQRTVVGTCAFKGPPKGGTVEIAYFTFPGFEGQGYATAMARRLIGMAAASPEVKRITARTLPEQNASTEVLKKVGMSLAGEAADPDDGVVWEWEWRSEA